jgi:hypothetical protein
MKKVLNAEQLKVMRSLLDTASMGSKSSFLKAQLASLDLMLVDGDLAKLAPANLKFIRSLIKKAQRGTK